MLSPKRTKYRKPHRVSYEGKASRGNKVSFGDFGLQSKECNLITALQI
jgi:large subunit ribosomal protein L16